MKLPVLSGRDVTLEGTVISENPAQISKSKSSEYSFKIDTREGLKVVFVEDWNGISIDFRLPPIGYRTITKEEIEALIK